MAQTPIKIEDFEVLVDSFRIMHSKTIGCKKFDRYMAIRLKHTHHITDDQGLADIFLTKYQAIDLIKELANIIATNDLLYAE